MIPANKTSSSSSLGASSSSSSLFSDESPSSDDSSSFSSRSSCSSFFSGSEETAKLGIISKSDSSSAAAQNAEMTMTRLVPAQFYNINGDDDSSSFLASYSTSSSSSSGSEQTIPPITQFDSSSSLLAQLVPCCHLFAALTDFLVNTPCGVGEGSTMGTIMRCDHDNQQPRQQQQNHMIMPDSAQTDLLLLKKNPLLGKINHDKIEEPSAGDKNAETTTTRLALAPGSSNNVSSSMTKSSQHVIKQTAITLLDFFGLNDTTTAILPKRQQAPSPSISYNNKMSIVVGGFNSIVNAPPIPVSGIAHHDSQVPPAPPIIGPALVPVPVSGRRTPCSQVPPPIGYGFTLVKEEQPQPQTLKGDSLPTNAMHRLPESLPKTNKKTPQACVSSTSLAGCFQSAMSLSPLLLAGSPSCAKSFWQPAAGPSLSTIAAASFFTDPETQQLLVTKSSDLIHSNSETDEPEPALSDLVTITHIIDDTLTSWTEASTIPDSHQLSMTAPVFARELVDLMPIPERPASKTPTTSDSVATVPVLKQRTMTYVIKTPKKTPPNTTATATKALLETNLQSLANRNSKKKAKLRAKKAGPQAPMTKKATVTKITKAKRHTTSKATLSKARIPAGANRMIMKKAAPTSKGRVPPRMTTVGVATATPDMPQQTPAKPHLGPLIPVTTKKSMYKLQYRSPAIPLVAQK